MKHKTQLRYY